MGILEKIKDIEQEMERTQKNKATEHHFGLMKARLVFSNLNRQNYVPNYLNLQKNLVIKVWALMLSTV